jgi:hypothetical protein
MARHLLKDDGDGLFLYVPPSGVSAWQFRYKLEGRSQTLTIGKLADIALRDVWSGVAT